MIAAGFALMFVGAFVVGAVNGLLIRFANFTAIAATLAIYIGMQGLSFLLRDGPGGYINSKVVEVLNWQIGPIPVAFAVLVAFALAASIALRQTRGPAGSCGRRVRTRARRGASACGSIAPSSPATSALR